MNKQHYHNLIFLLVVTLFLAACGSSESQAPTSPAAIPQPTKTPTLAPTATDTPIPTVTPEPTATLIPAAVFIEEGDAFLAKSEWEQAIEAYEQAIELHEDPLAYAHLGYLYQNLPDKLEDGLELVQKAAELAPDEVDVQAYLAWAFLNNHMLDEAVATAETAVNLDAESALAATILSQAYLAINRYDEALEMAETAVELDPEMAFAHMNLAAAYAAVTRFDDAIDAADDAYVLSASFTPYLVQRAYFYGLNDDLDTQRQILSRALILDENYAPALHGYANYDLNNNNYSEALEKCDQIVELYPELPIGYACRGMVYLDKEAFDEAETNFDLAIDRDVEDADGYFGRSRVLLDQGDCAAGRAEMEKVSELRPHSSMAHNMIGLSYLCEEEPTAAIESFQTALDMNPFSSLANYGLGESFVREERFEEAEGLFRTAIELEPQIYFAYLSLGQVLAQQDELEEAEEAFLQAQEVDPFEIDVFLALGEFYLEQNRNWDAQGQFEAALELDENNVQGLIGLGYSLAIQDHCGAAMQHFDKARELDPDNFVADDLYYDCLRVWRYENPPGPQGEVINDATAASLAQSAVVNRLGIPGDTAFAEFQNGPNGRILIISYLSKFDPNSNPTEFANELNAAMFAASDAFVRADSAPVILAVSAFAIQGQEVVFLGARSVHRTDAVDWWNGSLSDGAYIGKFFVE